MNVNKKVNAKVRSDGSLIVKLDEQPGCIAVVVKKAEITFRYAVAFFAGALFGILVQVIWK